MSDRGTCLGKNAPDALNTVYQGGGCVHMADRGDLVCRGVGKREVKEHKEMRGREMFNY